MFKRYWIEVRFDTVSKRKTARVQREAKRIGKVLYDLATANGRKVDVAVYGDDFFEGQKELAQHNGAR